MKIGDIDVVGVSDGGCRLPASALYPRMPAEAWRAHERWLNPDGSVEFPIGCFLVRTGERVILVDAGLGPLEREGLWGGALLTSLAEHGHRPEDVTDVVCTHLHFDHVGWLSQQGRPVFENATVRCHADDWEHFWAEEHGARRKLAPVADRVELFDDITTLAPGVDTLPAPGHTPGHTMLVLSSGIDRALILGDLAHCPFELEDAAWDGIGDVDRELARLRRAELAEMLEREQVPAAAPHFPELAFGRMVRAEGTLRWTFPAS